MKVSKQFILLNIFLFFNAMIYAQSLKIESVNRQNAVRCLNLAENSMLSSDWENAIKQSDLGLSYDETISDLYYFKASAQSNLKLSRKDVLETIRKAFEKDNWLNYNKTGARILLADLLCDYGQYQESLNILDNENFIYSADSEVIRIKNYYRMGTSQSINQARLKINSARRIYPNDERFPSLFFLFETKFITSAKRNNIDYQIPDIVQNIAESYIVKFPDYDNPDSEIEMFASSFLTGERRKRFVNSISAKNKEYPLYAISRLAAGIITQQQAVSEFIPIFEESIPLDILENFLILITEEDQKNVLFEYLNSFSGIILIDENLDLQNELIIQYDRGRPSYISYDKNNDGIFEVKCECDFGSPQNIVYENENIQLNYDVYPYVKEILFPEEKRSYTFYDKDYEFSPFEMIKDSIVLEFGFDFYIPLIKKEISEPDKNYIVANCTKYRMPITEFENSFVEYSYLDGKPVSAVFYKNDVEYAHILSMNENSIKRYIDDDEDGKFEKIEEFTVSENAISDDKKAYVDSVFGENQFSSNLVLSKVEIDGNMDTIPEFIEEYFGVDGVRTSWNTNGDDVWDVQYIRYSIENDNSQITETIYFNPDGTKLVDLICINGKPTEMTTEDKKYQLTEGFIQNIYWIGEVETDSIEQRIYSKIDKTIQQGVINLIEENENRYFVIRVEDNFFIQKSAESYLEETETVEAYEEVENSNE